MSFDMRRKAEVAVGQMYREAGKGYLGSTARCWRVEAVMLGVDGRMHATVSSVDLTHTRKTLSVAVLLDAGRYTLVPQPAAQAA